MRARDKGNGYCSVIVANDGVMPQTIKAINHAKEANVPIIVAINKMIYQNPDRVNKGLQKMVCWWKSGGDTIAVHFALKDRYRYLWK